MLSHHFHDRLKACAKSAKLTFFSKYMARLDGVAQLDSCSPILDDVQPKFPGHEPEP